MSKFEEKSKMNTGDNHTEQSSRSFTILYAIKYTIRYYIKYLSGSSFAKQSLVQIIYKYKMHHRWVCAKGRGDYLQQVHLRIFHSSKHCLASDKRKQKHRHVNNIGGDWLLQSGRFRPTMEQSECVDHEVCETDFVCFFLSAFYSAFSLPPSTGFTGSASSSRACCRSLSFTSCTPQ